MQHDLPSDGRDIDFNDEVLVSASHQLVLITSLLFVHRPRSSYRLTEVIR